MVVTHHPIPPIIFPSSPSTRTSDTEFGSTSCFSFNLTAIKQISSTGPKMAKEGSQRGKFRSYGTGDWVLCWKGGKSKHNEIPLSFGKFVWEFGQKIVKVNFPSFNNWRHISLFKKNPTEELDNLDVNITVRLVGWLMMITRLSLVKDIKVKTVTGGNDLIWKRRSRLLHSSYLIYPLNHAMSSVMVYIRSIILYFGYKTAYNLRLLPPL